MTETLRRFKVAMKSDFIHLRARLIRRDHLRIGRHEAVFHGEHAGAAQRAALLFISQPDDFVGVGGHARRGGDPIQRVLAQLRFRVRADVAVRVDDARHDEPAGEIVHDGARRDRAAGRRLHLADAAVFHHDGHVVLRGRAGAVDDGGMGENGDLRCDARREQQRRRQDNEPAGVSRIDSLLFCQIPRQSYQMFRPGLAA